MSRDARSRVVLGIGIPFLAFVFIVVLVLAFARVLLVVPETLAPWVALLFAVNILVGCALAASIRGTRGFAFLIATLIATIVFGGVAGAFIPQREVHNLAHEEGVEAAERGTEEQDPSAAEEPSPEATNPSPTPQATGQEGKQGGPAGGASTIVAQNLEFDVDQLTVPAEGEALIVLDNQEAVPHNVSVYTSEGGEPLFQGEVVAGPTEIEYAFPAPAPGVYHFQCDVHPTTMTGTLTVQ